MSEFTDIMRQARRMCNTQEDCESCPIWNPDEFFCKIDTTCHSDDSVIENIVMQWAKEHPETVYPTWREWQNNTFKDAHKLITPCTFGSRDRFKCEGKTCYYVCMDQQIPADIAKKLGIKIITEDEFMKFIS